MGVGLVNGVLLARKFRVFLERHCGYFCEEMHSGLGLTVSVCVEFSSSLLVKTVTPHIFLSL